MLVRPKQSRGRYSTRVRLGNEELGFVDQHRYLGLVTTADCRDDNDIEKEFRRQGTVGKTLIRSFNLNQWRQKSNCSSHIVNQFIGVLFCVIHTTTILENSLSCYSDTFKRHAMNAIRHIDVVFGKSAYSLMSRVTTSPNSIVTAIVNSDAYQQSPLMLKWESILYVYE